MAILMTRLVIEIYKSIVNRVKNSLEKKSHVSLFENCLIIGLELRPYFLFYKTHQLKKADPYIFLN